MGLALPLGIVAGLAVATLLAAPAAQSYRRVGAICIAALLSLTSIFWLRREIQMGRENLSNTTVHTPYLEADVTSIMRVLSERRRPGDIVVAPPGLAAQTGEDEFRLGVPDLNPILSGWGGMTTFAGHWSETPNYAERRNYVLERVFLADDPIVALAELQANYVVTPIGDFASSIGLNPNGLLGAGTPLYTGERWALVAIGDQ
jgi:arabinosyltransferase C